MPDLPAIVLRFALFADLALIFGMARFAIAAPAAVPEARVLAVAAVVGLVLSALGIMTMAAGMMGVALSEIDRETIEIIFFETGAGTAAILRMAALAAVVGLSLWRPVHWLTIVAGGVALATLAWNGHAAASEGAAAPLHLASDIVHLLAAGAWLGALICLVILLLPIGGAISGARLDMARRALSDFSIAGSIIVALIAITGVANIAFILGRDVLSTLFTNLYGQLLVAKIALFFVMLGLAVANRYRLTPRLERAIALNDGAKAVSLLRLSLIIETLAALVIFALVAWLGTLAPA